MEILITFIYHICFFNKLLPFFFCKGRLKKIMIQPMAQTAIYPGCSIIRYMIWLLLYYLFAQKQKAVSFTVQHEPVQWLYFPVFALWIRSKGDCITIIYRLCGQFIIKVFRYTAIPINSKSFRIHASQKIESTSAFPIRQKTKRNQSLFIVSFKEILLPELH